jgi:hypothetical protein
VRRLAARPLFLARKADAPARTTRPVRPNVADGEAGEAVEVVAMLAPFQ